MNLIIERHNIVVWKGLHQNVQTPIVTDEHGRYEPVISNYYTNTQTVKSHVFTPDRVWQETKTPG